MAIVMVMKTAPHARRIVELVVRQQRGLILLAEGVLVQATKCSKRVLPHHPAVTQRVDVGQMRHVNVQQLLGKIKLAEAEAELAEKEKQLSAQFKKQEYDKNRERGCCDE